MGDTIQMGTGEIVGDFDQYVAFKGYIEGFFNNLGTDELIERAQEALRHPVAIIDLGFYIVGESSEVRNDPSLHREDDGAFLAASAAMQLRRHYLFGKIHKKSYCSAIIPYGPNPFIAATINISLTSVLLMLVFSNGTELTPQDMMNVKKATQLLVLQFQKESARKDYQPLAYNRTIAKLLDGEPVSPQDIENEKLNLPWLGDASALRLLLITDPAENGLDSLTGSISQMLLKYIPLSECMLYQDAFLAFVNEQQFRLICEENRGEMEEFLAANHLYGIVSRPFSDIRRAASVYQKTLKSMGTNVRFHIHFSLQSEMSFRIIADMLSAQYDIVDFCHPAILFLRDYDEENNTELLYTLICYLTYHQDLSVVLEKLHIGKSTLFYRLGKIKEAAGISLNDSEELFELFFSYKLLKNMDMIAD